MYLQQCERYRNDVSTIYLPHASYEWYKIVQSKNFKHLKFPGKLYNPAGRKINAFNMEYILYIYIFFFYLENLYLPITTTLSYLV